MNPIRNQGTYLKIRQLRKKSDQGDDSGVESPRSQVNDCAWDQAVGVSALDVVTGGFLGLTGQTVKLNW